MKVYSGAFKLIGLLIIAPIIIWNLAFKSTYQLYEEQKLMKELTLPITVTNRLVDKNIFTDSILVSNGKILKLLAPMFEKYNIKMENYTPVVADAENQYKLFTGDLIVSGKFIDVVQLIATIEKQKLPLKIASVNFSSYDLNKVAHPEVLTTILLLSLE